MQYVMLIFKVETNGAIADNVTLYVQLHISVDLRSLFFI